jgi:septum site-determining protein MinC
MAFILRAEPPLAAWFEELDAQIARSPSFFAGRPVILDLSALAPLDPDAPALVQALRERGIRLIDVEGYAAPLPGVEHWGPALAGGRSGALMDIPDDPPAPAAPAASAAESGLIIDQPVRSGQAIAFPAGDVTVLGGVASGAEVMAGGSIHVYGALRGRAIAGALGNGRARIFCRRLEAELVAIDGFYRTADDMDAKLRGRAVQIWLDSGAIAIAPLD